MDSSPCALARHLRKKLSARTEGPMHLRENHAQPCKDHRAAEQNAARTCAETTCNRTRMCSTPPVDIARSRGNRVQPRAHIHAEHPVAFACLRVNPAQPRASITSAPPLTESTAPLPAIPVLRRAVRQKKIKWAFTVFLMRSIKETLT